MFLLERTFFYLFVFYIFFAVVIVCDKELPHDGRFFWKQLFFIFFVFFIFLAVVFVCDKGLPHGGLGT